MHGDGTRRQGRTGPAKNVWRWQAGERNMKRWDMAAGSRGRLAQGRAEQGTPAQHGAGGRCACCITQGQSHGCASSGSGCDSAAVRQLYT